MYFEFCGDAEFVECRLGVKSMILKRHFFFQKLDNILYTFINSKRVTYAKEEDIRPNSLMY